MKDEGDEEEFEICAKDRDVLNFRIVGLFNIFDNMFGHSQKKLMDDLKS